MLKIALMSLALLVPVANPARAADAVGKEFWGACSYDRSRPPTFDFYAPCSGVGIYDIGDGRVMISFIDSAHKETRFAGDADLAATNGVFQVDTVQRPGSRSEAVGHGQCAITRDSQAVRKVRCYAYAGVGRYLGQWYAAKMK